MAVNSTWDIVAILRKQRQPLTRAWVWAESERESAALYAHANSLPLCGERFGCRTRTARDCVERKKYCSIYATLRAAIELVSDFEIEEGAHGD